MAVNASKDSKDKEKNGAMDERAKALAEAMQQIQKQFGKGAVMKLGDEGAKL
jgi:recombination protein RecA